MVRRLDKLLKTLSEIQAGEINNIDVLLKNVKQLINATWNMESDIHMSPAKLVNAKHRHDINCLSHFQLEENTKKVLDQEVQLYGEYASS